MKHKFLYHATYKAHLPSIKAQGIRHDIPVEGKTWDYCKQGVVFLATDLDVAASFAETTDNESIPEEWLNEIVVLKIDTTFLEPTKIAIDTEIQDNTGSSFEYTDTIPWAAVKKVTNY